MAIQERRLDGFVAALLAMTGRIAAPRDALAEVAEIRGRSLWQDAGRRLLRNRAAVVSMIVLAVIAALALLAPWLSPHPYDEIYWERIQAPPDFANAHWFGTDGNGRDLFVRTLYGARVSLMVGILATSVSLVIGVTWGRSPAISAAGSTT